jgi:predicted  nucleic acid-binding Zn-ribbon protein
MRISQLFLPLAATLLLAAGCTSQEDPAKNAVAQGEAALAAVREDAAKYAPEELKAPEATLTKFKDEVAKENYDAVLKGIAQFNAEMKTLNEAVTVKKTAEAAATNEWQALNTEVPKAVEEIENRMKNLTGSKLPKEVTKENFEAAKAGLEPLKAQWAEATAAASSGNVLDAADKGRQVKQKVEEMKTQLALNPV